MTLADEPISPPVQRILVNAAAPREVASADIGPAFRLDAAFTGTASIEPAPEDGPSGQERAIAALELGTGISGRGYNIFVTGLTGADRLEFLKRWLSERAKALPTPGDWMYLHNFKNPDEPRALHLPAGKAKELKNAMQDLVRTLRESLPKAFRQEAFDREKILLKEKYEARSRKMKEEFDEHAEQKGFLVSAGENGNVFLVPIVNGKPLESPDEFAKIPEEGRQEIAKRQEEVVHEMEKFVRAQHDIVREMEAEVRDIEKHFGKKLLDPLIARILEAIPSVELKSHLAETSDHILAHLDDFKEQHAAAPVLPFLQAAVPEKDSFIEYEVNVVVDNSGQSGGPVVVENSPTHMNLFGTIERIVDKFGRLVTNFTRIKSGSLLKADGGYLIFNLDDAITEAAVWKTLKRTLRSGRIEMDTYEPFAMFSTSGLKPEAITVNTKLIVVGTMYAYQFLFSLDDDFGELFKVHADFRKVVEATSEHIHAFLAQIAATCRAENLPHLDAPGSWRILAHASRMAEDREKIYASPAEIQDILRESAFQARRESSPLISDRHVQAALDHRVFRANRIEHDLRELTTRGTILLDIEGRKIGQVNGLAVIDMGGYAFGRPSRVTASASMGNAGIVNIEREANMSGNIHNKGVFILAGFIRNTFGQEKPIALSASLCFEQSYSGIDGDSASSTELYALLSRLAEIPLRQDLAVTGSVNQWGEVQAIGGVNEKIEGFFDACRVAGLTGRQGVMIPEANVRHLLLRSDIVKAVEQKTFHIHPVKTIAEGIEILTGVKAGTPGEAGTVFGEVQKRFDKFLAGMLSSDNHHKDDKKTGTI